MENREILFQKIEAKEKEWRTQLQQWQSKTAGLDFETRVKIQAQLDNLDTKLKKIETRTSELKNIINGIQNDLGEKIMYAWIEIFTEIDDVMLNLKNKLGL